MTTQPDTEQQAQEEEWMLVEPDISDLEIEDDEPLVTIESEKQQRLLTESLYSSWTLSNGERPFFAAANVGIFFQEHAKPIVPDILLSLDVKVSQDIREKRNRTYFVWTFGKVPEVVIEIVSNRKGGELTRKQQTYAQIGCSYYVLFDPSGFLKDETLQIFELQRRQYVARTDRWLSDVGLGLTLWKGNYEGLEIEWLRWCYEDGTLVPTGAERADQERERADQEHERAERLAAKLRALGIDPEE